MKVLVCVEGGIGAGKSTLLDGISSMRLKGIAVVKEPVEEWRARKVTSQGQNLLGAMYSGEVSPAVFQMAVLQSRFGKLVRALVDPTNEVVISERSPWSEKIVFARPNLSEVDFECYSYTHECMLRDLFHLVGDLKILFLHLTIPHEKLIERIQKRGRAEEADIGENYLKIINEAHAKLMVETKEPIDLGSESIKKVHHLSINADQQKEEVKRLILENIALFCSA